MNPIEILESIEMQGHTLSLFNGQIKIASPFEKPTPEQIDLIKTQKPALIVALKSRELVEAYNKAFEEIESKYWLGAENQMGPTQRKTISKLSEGELNTTADICAWRNGWLEILSKI